jgi:precorrin-3B C17-methyltransferase
VSGTAGSGGGPPRGRLTVVSIGPGSPDHLSDLARRRLQEAEMVLGYQRYLDFVRPLIGDAACRSSGMRSEVKRSREAIQAAEAGRRVCLVSGGDAGIYGMAGLVLELLPRDGEERFDLEIVPGITAASAAAAVLGAPLMNDFAAVSLSDLMTPAAVILDRLQAAARGDFTIVLYNPQSRRRRTLLGKAREIILRQRGPDTPVGIVWNAGRPGQRAEIHRLADFPTEGVDMSSIVIVGSSQSYTRNGRLVTPRGYPLMRTP